MQRSLYKVIQGNGSSETQNSERTGKSCRSTGAKVRLYLSSAHQKLLQTSFSFRNQPDDDDDGDDDEDDEDEGVGLYISPPPSSVNLPANDDIASLSLSFLLPMHTDL